MPAPERIKRLVAQFKEKYVFYQSVEYNEEQLRHEFLNPFFAELGWDMENVAGQGAERDVHYEKRIKTGAPDFGFYLENKLRFFVEAKNPSKRVSQDDKAAMQLRTYGWSAKLARSILTDFEEFVIYDTTVRPKSSDKARVARLECIKYDQYVERWEDIVAFFSREAVVNGSLEKLDKKRTKQAVDDDLLKDISRWREELAKDIALRNGLLSEEQINRAVQDTLDRIIFLRVCEDRGIEPENRLWEATEDGDVYGNVLRIFRKAEQRYDSGLFEMKKGPELQISSTVLADIIAGLYFPQSPYQFDVIPTEILGQVYEQFLGKVIRLTAGHHAKVEEKQEVRKAGGVYYTPDYIVEYIVKNTVGKLVEGKNPKQIATLSIIDPACGSGSFLLGAYQYLMGWYVDWYSRNDAAKFKKNGIIYNDHAGRWQLHLAERKRILTTHIFGVDIDPQAVEVAKLSLMLKALEAPEQSSIFNDQLLPNLSSNIKCGNSLIGTDFFSGQIVPDMAEMARINPFDWEVEFPEIFKRGGFDAVIGNPPWGGNIDKEIEYFHGKYRATTKEHTDSYKIFIEAGLKYCRPGGLVSMIVPNTLIRQNRLKDVRMLLLSKELHSVVNLGDKVFKGVVAPSCVFVLVNDDRDETSKITLMDLSDFSEQERVRALQNNNVSSQSFFIDDLIKNSGFEFARAQMDLRVPTLPLGKFEGLACKDAGINYQRVGVGMREKGKSDLADRLLYDGDILDIRDKMYWRGADIDRYSIVESTKHFCRPYYRDFIRSNEVVHLSIKVYDTAPKILIRQTADRIIAALDTKGVWFARSILSILPTREEYDPEYFIGILNSKFFSHLYKNLVHEVGRAFAQVKLNKIKELPIRLIDFQNIDDRKKHDELVIAVKSNISLHKLLLIDSPKTDVLRRQIEATDRQIDQLVYQLYGLTSDEIRIVEEGTK